MSIILEAAEPCYVRIIKLNKIDRASTRVPNNQYILLKKYLTIRILST